MKYCRLCACGCGRRVKRPRARYFEIPCIPKSTRQAAGAAGRRTYAYRRRAVAFRADLERLGRTPTREDLLMIFHRIYKRGYNSGFQIGVIGGRNAESSAALKRAQEREAA